MMYSKESWPFSSDTNDQNKNGANSHENACQIRIFKSHKNDETWPFSLRAPRGQSGRPTHTIGGRLRPRFLPVAFMFPVSGTARPSRQGFGSAFHRNQRGGRCGGGSLNEHCVTPTARGRPRIWPASAQGPHLRPMWGMA